MKTSNRNLIVVLIIILAGLNFQSCKPADKPVYKPNVYIYPTVNVDLDVNLTFPRGGMVIESIPEYGDGWHVTVNTAGIIDEQYRFLFYESSQPDIWQNELGWIVAATDLEVFFRQNMFDYGFRGAEIEDFIEYWIPRFTDYPFYSIYPQTAELINDVVLLNFSLEPNNLLRLFYVVEGENENGGVLIEPSVNSFKREGYYVTEWGVIL